MKRPNFLFILAASFVIFTIASCKKDKNDPKDQFTYDGETFELTQGYIEDYGDNGNGSYDFDITLVSNDINFIQETGIGHLVYLDLNTSNEFGLVEGTYNFSEEREAFTLVDGIIAISFDLDTETGELYNAISGTVIIEIDGNETKIEFNLVMANNKNVSGEFKGVLIDLD